MRARTMLLSLVVLVGAGAARPALAELPLLAAAPAYDAATQSSVRNLATALHSYTLETGGLDGVDAEELAGWGWVPEATTAVTIWAGGEEFRVVAQDVRPGASAFEYTTVAPGPGAGAPRFGRSAVVLDDPVPGVTILPLAAS